MIIRHKKILITLLSFGLLILFSTTQSPFQTKMRTSNVDDAFSFSLDNGFYEHDIQVALSLPESYLKQMQIRYTVDGSTPDATSPLYEEPLSFHAEQTAKAITIKAVVCDSQSRITGGPYTATYFIGKNIDAWPVNALIVSITADPDDLFSPERGILYPMADCGPTAEDWERFKKQNCKQRGTEWIRDAHMDIFEPDGTNVISQNIGLCVDGDHGSMTHYPYSLKVLADRQYDASHPLFAYDFFQYYNTKGTIFPHIQCFNNMVFRNGGNEYNAGAAAPEQRGTMLRWNVGSHLADEAGYMVAGSRPAMVFLNGTLYSAAQLQDTYNHSNTAVKTLLNKGELEIYKDSEKACTEQGGYLSLYYSYPEIASSPLRQPENQNKLEQIVSMDDMFSYYAFELMVNNTDYPKKNYAIWRYNGEETEDMPYADGKYRFLINDLDCIWDFRYDDDLWTAYFGNVKEDGVLMASLVQIDAYRDRFLNAVCDLLNSGLFDREHLDAVITESNNAFSTIASHYYSPQDEEKRQRNVALLKESAFARKEQVRAYIQETFHPAAPYTLSVKAPETGAAIHFSTTTLTASDGNFTGDYYGDYPLTLSASCNDFRKFSYWKINGKRVDSPEVTLDTTLIQNGKITVSLVTVPVSSPYGLLISELYSGPSGAWIELYNASGRELELGDYALSNQVPARYMKFSLPQQTLAPGETFVAGVDNTGLFRLEQGQAIYLTRGTTVADSAQLPIMAATESYGRLGETNEWRYYVYPTKGAAN